MPQRPKSPCKYSGCPLLTPKGNLCAMHEKQERRKIEATRESAYKRGYDRRWARLRKMVLSEEPLCREHLSKGKAVPATEVDHIKPKEEGGDDSRKNLQALCKECHSRKTAREGRWGRGD